MKYEKSELAAAARERLVYLDGLLVAIDRRTEVIALVADSESADEALPALMALLTIPEHVARAVLDLQIRRLAKLERSRILEERDYMRGELLRNQ